MKKTFLFDLGNTIMRDFPDEKGKMKAWNKIEAMPNAEMMLEKLYQQHDCFIATNAKDSLKEDIIEALPIDDAQVNFIHRSVSSINKTLN